MLDCSSKVDAIINSSMKKKKSSCIYRLFYNGVVVYVGQTINIRARIINHIPYKNFDFFDFEFCEKSDANELEAESIARHKPIHNKALPRNKKLLLLGTVKSEVRKLTYEILESMDHVKISDEDSGYKYITKELRQEFLDYINRFKAEK